LQAHLPHQAEDRTARDIKAFPRQLPPDLAHAADLEVLIEHASDLDLHDSVALRPSRPPGWIAPLGRMVIVRRWGDRQQLADRLDPIRLAVIVDERDHGLDRRSSSAWAK
jgi:hypothetical protein